MSEGLAAALHALLRAGERVAHVAVVEAHGSTPREAGAAMLVTARHTLGTVGGGRLEWQATARARALLDAGEAGAALALPLGPAIGQCCGGAVTLAIRRADALVLAEVEAQEQAARDALPLVLVFGAGHVGQALVRALAPLPFRVRWLDPRPLDTFGQVPDGVETVAEADCAAHAERAPANSALVVLTHSHALDSLVTAAALARGDLAYVGLIGSHTKRRRFERAFREIGLAPDRVARLVCPIGERAGIADKRPAVIAALTAAELVETFARRATRERRDRAGEQAA